MQISKYLLKSVESVWYAYGMRSMRSFQFSFIAFLRTAFFVACDAAPTAKIMNHNRYAWTHLTERRTTRPKLCHTPADKMVLEKVSNQVLWGVWVHARVRAHKNVTKREFQDGSVAPQQTALSR